jgi:hypothetical protein
MFVDLLPPRKKEILFKSNSAHLMASLLLYVQPNSPIVIAKGIGWKIKPVGQLLLMQSNSIAAAAASCSPFVYLQSN